MSTIVERSDALAQKPQDADLDLPIEPGKAPLCPWVKPNRRGQGARSRPREKQARPRDSDSARAQGSNLRGPRGAPKPPRECRTSSCVRFSGQAPRAGSLSLREVARKAPCDTCVARGCRSQVPLTGLERDDQPGAPLSLVEAVAAVVAVVTAAEVPAEIGPVAAGLETQADVLAEEDLDAAAEARRETVVRRQVVELGLDAGQPRRRGDEGIDLPLPPLEKESRLQDRQVHVAQGRRGRKQAVVDDELAPLAIGQDLDLPVGGQGNVEQHAVDGAGVDLDVEVGIEVAVQPVSRDGGELEAAGLGEGGRRQEEKDEGEEGSAHGLSLVAPSHRAIETSP